MKNYLWASEQETINNFREENPIIILISPGEDFFTDFKDIYGNCYTWFLVDSLAGQLPGTCVDCGSELWEGYLCLDGGQEYCEDHVLVLK